MEGTGDILDCRPFQRLNWESRVVYLKRGDRSRQLAASLWTGIGKARGRGDRKTEKAAPTEPGVKGGDGLRKKVKERSAPTIAKFLQRTAADSKASHGRERLTTKNRFAKKCERSQLGR